jgi:hypothetical protein
MNIYLSLAALLFVAVPDVIPMGVEDLRLGPDRTANMEAEWLREDMLHPESRRAAFELSAGSREEVERIAAQLLKVSDPDERLAKIQECDRYYDIVLKNASSGYFSHHLLYRQGFFTPTRHPPAAIQSDAKDETVRLGTVPLGRDPEASALAFVTFTEKLDTGSSLHRVKLARAGGRLKLSFRRAHAFSQDWGIPAEIGYYDVEYSFDLKSGEVARHRAEYAHGKGAIDEAKLR